MGAILEHIGIAAWGKLGRCRYCMAAAFRSAAGLWLLAAVLAAVSAGWIWVGGAGTLALGATVLWVAHLVAYAVRLSVAKYVKPVCAGGAGEPMQMIRRSGARSWARS